MGLYFQKNDVKTNKVNLTILVERKVENESQTLTFQKICLIFLNERL